jgi:hypothetical protein
MIFTIATSKLKDLLNEGLNKQNIQKWQSTIVVELGLRSCPLKASVKDNLEYVEFDYEYLSVEKVPSTLLKHLQQKCFGLRVRFASSLIDLNQDSNQKIHFKIGFDWHFEDTINPDRSEIVEAWTKYTNLHELPEMLQYISDYLTGESDYFEEKLHFSRKP